VTRRGDLLEMDFPAIAAHVISPPAGLVEALGVRPQETLGSAEDLLVVLDTDLTVREVQPDFPALARIACRGIIITARGEQCDFVSTLLRSPTGHTGGPGYGFQPLCSGSLLGGKDGQERFACLPSLETGRRALLHPRGERVKISGQSALYMEGMIII